MKINRYILLIFLSIWNQSSGQQVINNVLDPSAFAIRGIAIPGMLTAAITMKNEQANSIIPDIIKEESTELTKWRNTVIGNFNTLNALAIDSDFLIESIEFYTSIIPVLYAPGFRKERDKFLVLKERVKRLNKRVDALAGLSTMFIDGEGYYRVACQRLAIEYLEAHSELAKIDFKLSQLKSFIILLSLMAA